MPHRRCFFLAHREGFLIFACIQNSRDVKGSVHSSAGLLAWACSRPEWQQDCLRWLALNGELTDDDLTGLRLQIECAMGLSGEDIADPLPLTCEHLSYVAGNAPKTVLASLGPVQNIDRLASDQPALRFAVNGITLIYGANASGKSGYCRIAKQLCRSVSPGMLRGNVYDDGSLGLQEVTVAFRVGDDKQPKQEQIWTGDQQPPPELAQICVFDTATARVYIDKERKIEFLPYELDLLNKLGLACRTLDDGFKKRETAAKAAVRTSLADAYTDGTDIHAAVSKLVSTTTPAKLPSEESLRTLGKWSNDQQAELDTVTRKLNRDPQILLQQWTAARQALETIKESISEIADTLGNPALTVIRHKKCESDAKSRAAEAAAVNLFGTYIPK